MKSCLSLGVWLLFTGCASVQVSPDNSDLMLHQQFEQVYALFPEAPQTRISIAFQQVKLKQSTLTYGQRIDLLLPVELLLEPGFAGVLEARAQQALQLLKNPNPECAVWQEAPEIQFFDQLSLPLKEVRIAAECG